MHIILGATGHVGSAVARALLQREQPVTVVTRDAAKAADWQQRGAQVTVADVHDAEALRRVLRQGRRLFLLNPPAPPDSDTAAAERRSLQAILRAVDGSGLERIVAESTYGAQPGGRIGDLGVLYELEQALAAQPIPHSIIRGAYYMSNWDGYLDAVRQSGELATFYPVDFRLPMVAPQDIGQVAARLLTAPNVERGPHFVEGPARYSPAEVAAAFAAALGQPVRAVQLPRAQWPATLRGMGFSEAATASFVAMTDLTLQGDFPRPEATERGHTTLQAYVQALVQRAAG